jgi:hypothetical protein
MSGESSTEMQTATTVRYMFPVTALYLDFGESSTQIQATMNLLRFFF